MSDKQDKKLEALLQQSAETGFEPFFTDRVMERLENETQDPLALFAEVCQKMFSRFAVPAAALCLVVMTYNLQTSATSDMGPADNFVEAVFSIPPSNPTITPVL